jgi:hypothetical protein
MLLTLKMLSRAVSVVLFLIVFLCCCSSPDKNGSTPAGESVAVSETARQQSVPREPIPTTQGVETGPGRDEKTPTIAPETATKTLTSTPQATDTRVATPRILPAPGDLQAFVRTMALRYAIPLAEIPYDLKRNPPSYMPYYPGIPEIQELRQQLRTADPQDKGIYAAQILAYLGVQTREEAAGEPGPDVWVPKWHNYDEHGIRILTCNTYAANAIRALGLECCMSHWFASEGNPNDHMEGTEYRAENVHDWLTGPKGQEYGWFDASLMPLEDRIQLLREGFLFYGANRVHNWVIFGLPYGEVEVVPVLTQSIPNTLYGVPSSFHFQNPAEGTLFAHKLPHN